MRSAIAQFSIALEKRSYSVLLMLLHVGEGEKPRTCQKYYDSNKDFYYL